MSSRKNLLKFPQAIFLIFIFSIFLELIFWYVPLDNIGSIKTIEQDPNFSDSNYYLYWATEFCQNPEIGVDELNKTWSSSGIIGYLTYGCRLFNTEFFYIILNPFIFVMGIFIYKYSLKNYIDINKIGFKYLILLPYTCLIIASPGKEVISIFGYMEVITGLSLLTINKKKLGAYLLIFCGLLILYMNRPHEMGMVMIFSILWLLGFFKNWYRIIIIGITLIYGADYLLSNFDFGLNIKSLNDENLWSGDSSGKLYNIDFLSQILHSNNIIVHALLGPLRIILVIFSPLISLISWGYETDFNYYLYRDLSQKLRIFDLIFIIYVFSQIYKYRISGIDCKLTKVKSLLPWFFIYMIYIVTFFGITQKSRYIFEFTPVLLLWLWISQLENSSE